MLRSVFCRESIFTIAFWLSIGGIVISSSCKSILEIEGMDEPLAFAFNHSWVLGWFINQTRYSDKIPDRNSSLMRITRNVEEATQYPFLLSYCAAKFFDPLAAKITSPSFNKCFSVWLLRGKSGNTVS